MPVRPRPRSPCYPCWMNELTPREQQIYALRGQGLTTAEIAEQLGIAYGTARNHVTTVNDKLGTPGSPPGLRRWADFPLAARAAAIEALYREEDSRPASERATAAEWGSTRTAPRLPAGSEAVAPPRSPVCRSAR